MRTGYSMTIRWCRGACDSEIQFLECHRQRLLRLNWQAFNTFIATRLRLNAKADELEDAIKRAQS